MSGHGEKRNRRQEIAIAALISEPTVEGAAAKAGIAPVTLWRWLRDDSGFREAYRAARRQVIEQAVANLQRAAGEAVETLRTNLHADSPSVQVRAAVAILEHAYRGAEVLDLAERINALEAQVADTERANEGQRKAARW